MNSKWIRLITFRSGLSWHETYCFFRQSKVNVTIIQKPVKTVVLQVKLAGSYKMDNLV